MDITQVKTFQMVHFEYVQLFICQLYTNIALYHYTLEKILALASYMWVWMLTLHYISYFSFECQLLFVHVVVRIILCEDKNVSMACCITHDNMYYIILKPTPIPLFYGQPSCIWHMPLNRYVYMYSCICCKVIKGHCAIALIFLFILNGKDIFLFIYRYPVSCF